MAPRSDILCLDLTTGDLLKPLAQSLSAVFHLPLFLLLVEFLHLVPEGIAVFSRDPNMICRFDLRDRPLLAPPDSPCHPCCADHCCEKCTGGHPSGPFTHLCGFLDHAVQLTRFSTRSVHSQELRGSCRISIGLQANAHSVGRRQ